MKTISKALVGTVAAGAMAITSASPAYANHRDGNGISAGDVIAGALIIGGIVAVAAATSNNDRDNRYGTYRNYGYGDGRYGDNRDDDDRDDNGRYGSSGYGYGNSGYGYGNSGYGYGNRDGYRGNPRQAIEQCVRTAEQVAASRYGRADVTDIREVKDSRYGWQIKGRIAVDTQRGDWRGRGNYGNGWGGDYRGWNSSMRGYDSGSFKCKVERGRVTDLDIDGIRGL